MIILRLKKSVTIFFTLERVMAPRTIAWIMDAALFLLL
jgi:hypothetical protein